MAFREDFIEVLKKYGKLPTRSSKIQLKKITSLEKKLKEVKEVE